MNYINNWYRDLSTVQAPTIKTNAGRLGFLIRMRRLGLGLTQRELASLVKIQRTHLSKIERGKVYPHSDTICAFERELEITLPRLNLARPDHTAYKQTFDERAADAPVGKAMAVSTRASLKTERVEESF